VPIRLPRLTAPRGLLHDLTALLGLKRVVVAGESMAPTLLPGDRLLVTSLALRFRRPRRGEIVVLHGRRYGFGDETDAIKRIIGLPHEHVTIAGGVVRVNGSIVPEPYLSAEVTAAWRAQQEPPREWNLAADEYFVLGDNRLRSRDSRAFGPVRARYLRGIAWYRYSPAGRRGRLRF
jgi:signal peptidase I